MRDQEYDRFGPWILEITDKDPLPPIFVPHITRAEKALLSIKIPRKIERRDAKPGWNLYDYVINMYENDFQIWKRTGTEVENELFKYTDVICLRNKEVLLNGALEIITESRTYTFSYNTVSSKIIKKAVDIIREKYTPQTGKKDLPEPELARKKDLDFYFQNLVTNEKKSNPDAALLFCQNRIKPAVKEQNILKKIFYAVISRELLETLHFCDGRELKIITRGRTFKSLISPLYGKEDIYLPVSRLKSVTAAEDEKSSFNKFIISTARCSLDFYSDKENPGFPQYPEFLNGFV